MRFEVTSGAFPAEGDIPARYTCDGQNASPALSWGEPPNGTKSIALLMEDPDAPGRTFVHWVMHAISASRRELPEGLPADDRLPGIGVQGRNDFGKLGYGGPCPPPGAPHRYFFRLYALDEEPSLSAGRTRDELLRAIEGHILGKAELMGRYARRG